MEFIELRNDTKTEHSIERLQFQSQLYDNFFNI